MNKIVTLTLNPIVDKNTTVNGFWSNNTLNSTTPIYYAGGGGVNVSRALRNLGGKSTAIYLAGGRTGNHLEQLLEKAGVVQKKLAISGNTRENLSVIDTISTLQYHFGMPGPFVNETEWKEVLNYIQQQLEEGDYLVASGKLPLGIPDDFYIKVATIVKKKNAKFVLDTKGIALTNTIASDIYLLKPNLAELSAICGVPAILFSELETMVQKFLSNHPCENIVVSLGSRGALLANRNIMKYIKAPIVHQKNRIGAGDSMVAGMLLAKLKGKSITEMVQYGVACGTAATLKIGAQLCHKDDVNSIYEWIKSNTKNQ